MKSPRNGTPSKKWTMGLFLLLSFFAVSALSAKEQIPPCQMLLSEAEQRAAGFDRQRAMYPPDRAKRLAMMSLRDGTAFMRKGELAKAMEELNRAWQFDPSNPYSYWLAGIVRAMEAARLTEHPIPEDWNEQRRLYCFFPERWSRQRASAFPGGK